MKLNFKYFRCLSFACSVVSSALLLGLLVICFPVGVGAASVSAPTNTGLVGYWKMDEGSGIKTIDSSGRGNTGTISSGTWTSGKLGKAMSFNGSTNSVSLTRSPFSGTSFTVAGWIKLTALQDKKFLSTIDVNPSTETRGVGFGVNTTVANGINGNSIILQTGKTFWSWSLWSSPTNSLNQINQWYHVVATITGADTATPTVTFYVNGVSQTATPWAGGVNSVNYGSNADASARIGGSYTATSPAYDTAYFNGSTDDIRVYNRALSATEVRSLYLSGSALLKPANNTGLIGYWPLDENTGTIAHDMGGNRKDGTFAGAPAWTTGKLGKALSFNGSSIVDMGSSMAGTFPAMTISAWVKPSSYGTYRAIVQTSTTGDKALYMQSSNLQFYSACNSSGTVPLNQWSHVTVTIDGSNNIIYYINGVASGGCASGSSPRIVEYLHISGVSTGDTENFQGSIDDVRVYNRVLSATEVSDLYRSGSSVGNANKNDFLTNGLVGLWSFDGGDINWGTNTAYDRSGQGNNGTIIGMNKSTSAVPGKIGQALKFNGFNAGTYVSLGTSATLTPANYTVSAWVNAGPTTYTTGYGYIYSNARDCCNAGQNGIDIQFTSGILYSYFWNSGSSVGVTSITGVPQNSGWHHIATTYNGSTLSVYVDGLFKNSTASALGVGSPASYSTNIGSMGYSAGTYMLDGKIDEVRLYNRALSATEIKQLYNNGR